MATKHGKQVERQSNRGLAVTPTSGPKYGPSHWPAPQVSTFHQRQMVTTRPESPDSNTAQDEADKNKYPCTFKGCRFRFPNRGALVKHKDSEHDYCTKCDLDFVDDEALHVHKMNSEKHIICPICGIDFKSEPGRDRHAKQMHAGQQNVQCRACHRTFAKGAALLLHFELNQCNEIKANNNVDMVVDQKAMLEAHRAMMALELHMREGIDFSKKRGDTSEAPSTAMTESVDGGVRIPTSLLDDQEDEQELDEMIDLQSPILPSNAVSSQHSNTVLVPSRSASSQHSDTASVADTIRDIPNGKERQASISSSDTNTWSKRLFPGAKATPYTGEWAAASEKAESVKTTPTNLNSVNPTESGITIIEQGKRLEKDSLDGLYHCCFPKC
ncbi:MAG: hypothetical protein Q9191_006847, partial [Dirinaria sp. TL-2023a]